MATKKKKGVYDFPVVREELHRKDGADTNHDAIYRKDTGAQLGIVTRKYQLVQHAEAVSFVQGVLDEMKLKPEEPKTVLLNEGARMMHTLILPSERFHPKGLEKDDLFDPTITVVNSYDRTRSFGLLLGIKRLTCNNGAFVLEKEFNVRVKHAFNNIDFSKYMSPFQKAIEKTIEITTKKVAELVKMDGLEFLIPIMMEPIAAPLSFAQKYKEMVLEKLQDCVVVKRDEKGKIENIAAGNTPFSAYILWNILTEIATHKVELDAKRYYVSKMIAKKFFG